LKKTIRSR